MTEGESTYAKERWCCEAFAARICVSATQGHGQENTMAVESPTK